MSVSLKSVASLTAALLLTTGAALAQTKLNVYTALENDQLAPLKAAFEAANKGIEITWVRDSTGIVTARVLAEKANPQADVIWGVALSSILMFDKEGILEAYAPKGIEDLKPSFRDEASAPKWTGMDAFLSFIAVNQPEFAKTGAAPVKGWNDLLQPQLKGKLVMPNPASSGTGYLQVAGWLQSMGEDNGWAFMDKLHDNIGVYTHSGSAPHVQAAKGERTASVGIDMRAVKEKNNGAPLDVIVPADGVAWDMEATALVKGRPNAEAAKKLIDFTVSKEAHEQYAKFYAVVGRKDVNAAPKNYPTDAEAKMLKVDFGKMAADRDRVLAEWTRRYDGKSAPKN
ncbi:ABC transporter substrate-binding protein [Elstera cyanobacteriorum]|uniref:Putative 2-aminoethylphosphonate ABC transporter substrate-binding protein n=1 Tax=Elstera cyanobacteriorum TaxID=2022747 RepID=A0A255XTP0_9PROT|nr:putative 2-aminoethylphosphonate ABC transporter substrate-binding protein [Elstera cyanobacteriorum]OYQ20251.1 putative 2-aminoethylphosphonate ABC transporter substrate-binding protein [Elstera cyanobacteriorum]GFZ81558.1 ABC transporter substrate-binding protein [Elstera cyanobacteriorum]